MRGAPEEAHGEAGSLHARIDVLGPSGKVRDPRSRGVPGRASFALSTLVAVSAAACAGHVGRRDLLDQIDEGAPPPIVDVRSRGEYDAAHVPGAVHLPFYSILSGSEKLPEPRAEGDPIVVYCEHGPRAGIARAQLWFVSEHPVRFLDGHMAAWKRDGLPVEQVIDSDKPRAR